MHGACILSDADAGTCLYLANKLGTADITEEEEREIQTDLRNVLCLEQGVPVAVGSGMAALKYKIRAVAHSIKLTSRTWMMVAQQMTNTAVWVGDLGELGVSTVKTNVQALLGDWTVECDAQNAADDFENVEEDSAHLFPSLLFYRHESSDIPFLEALFLLPFVVVWPCLLPCWVSN